MKKTLTFGVIVLLMMGFNFNVFAQNSMARLAIPDSLLNNQGYDSIVASTYLNTGVLWDKVYPHVNLLGHQGFNDDDTAKGMDGFQAYLDLFYSATDTTNMIGFDSLGALYKHFQVAYDALPIMTMAYQYQMLKLTAFTDSLICLVDSQLVLCDSNINPFEAKTLWMASTRFLEVPTNEDFQVVIPGYLFFSNASASSETIIDMQIDFDDGQGYRSVSLDQVLSVQYTGEGEDSKIVKLKWNTSGGYKHASFLWKTTQACTYPAADPAPWPVITRNYTVNYIDYYGNIGQHSFTRTIENLIQASIPYNGKRAEGKAYVHYHDGADLSLKKFSKPIIFVEGLDLEDVYLPKSVGMLSTTLYGLEAPFNSFSSSVRLGSAGWPQLWGCDDDGLFDAARPFLDSLHAEGYDIIMLDFVDGADYIQRNAFLLVELIEQINANKIGNEPNVIIGASMGGQIVRYALSYMENNNIPHCTRLNVSFDSPWTGAHMPLGLQCFFDYQTHHGKSGSAREALNGLHRPAPKQLLNYHIWKAKNSFRTITGSSQKTITFNFNNQLAPCPERDQMILELENMGNYPRQCRNIAIVNGNNLGNQLFPAGQQYISHNNDHCWGFSIQNDIWAGNSGIAYIAELNQAKGAPKHFYKVQNMLALYNAPASIRRDMRDAYYGIQDGLKDQGCDTLHVHLIQATQGFIPSASALGLNTSNWHYRLDVIDKYGPFLTGMSPFDAYFAQGANEEHVQTTNGNMRFFMKELRLGVDVLGQENGTILTKAWNNPLENASLPGIDINNGGVLYLNADRKYYEGGAERPSSSKNSLSRVFLGSGCKPNKTININQGGKLVLGANNLSKKIAYLYIQSGATVNLNPGGDLVIHPGSKIFVQKGGVLNLNDAVQLEDGQIVVEDGGELIFDNQAGFNFNQYGSSVLIQGKLSVKSGAVISVNSNGKLIFDQDIPWITVNNQLVRDMDSYLDIEPGAKLHLIGLNSAFSNQTLLEIRKETILKDGNQDIFDEIIVQNGAIDIAPNAFLFVASPLDVIDAEIRSTQAGQLHGGLRIWNNSTINYLRRVTIKEGNPGVLVSGPGSKGHTEFRDCIIQDNFDGLKWNSGRHVVRFCQFTNNTRSSIYGLNLSGGSEIISSNFNFNSSGGILSRADVGIDLQGQEGSSLKLKGCTIDGFLVGIKTNDIDLRASCNTVQNSLIGLRSENALTYLNEEASNTFRWNSAMNLNVLGSSNGSGVYLYNGRNLFDLPLSANSSGFRHIDGDWQCYMPYLDYSSNYQFADFNYNKFLVPVNANYQNINDYFDLHVFSCSNFFNLAASIDVDLSVNNNSTPLCGGSSVVDMHPVYATLSELPASSAKVSGGDYFNETPLSQALDQALSDLSFGENVRDDKAALQMLIAILQGTVADQDANTVAYLNLAYNGMHQALNQAYQQDQLQHNKGEALAPVQELDQVVGIANDWLLPLNPLDSSDHALIFQLNLDKVHAYRVAGHYTEALNLLINRANWTFDFVQSQRASYWNCVCEQERDYFAEEIPAEEFDYGLELCRQSFAGFTYKRGNSPLPAAQSIEGTLEAYPQPVEDVLSIELASQHLEEIDIELFSLGGQLVRKEILRPSEGLFKLDMSGLKSGLYVIHIKGIDLTEVLKVLKK